MKYPPYKKKQQSTQEQHKYKLKKIPKTIEYNIYVEAKKRSNIRRSRLNKLHW